MMDQNASIEDPITASNWIPWPIRLMLGGSGAFAIMMSLKELGPALWPLSFLTFFFGVIVCGAISIGCAFIAAALLSPSLYWEITKGTLLVRTELHGKITRRTFSAIDFISLEVKAHTDNDGPDTFSLVGHLTQDAQCRSDFDAAPNLHRLAALLWSPFNTELSKHQKEPVLKSPNFRSCEHAEAARARIMQVWPVDLEHFRDS